MNLMVVLIPAAVVFLLLVGSSARMVQQYEQGIVFRFGRLRPGNREPGLTFVVPLADRMVKVSMQTVVFSVPAQGAITRDNVTLTVDAVVYFAVIDPVKAVVNVRNYQNAVSQVAQTSLRSVIGAPTWTPCSRTGSRSTPSSRRSSMDRPRSRGACASNGSRSRTSRCPNR